MEAEEMNLTEYKVTETGKILVSELEPTPHDATAPEEGMVKLRETTINHHQESLLENRKRVLEGILLMQVKILKKYLFMKDYNIHVDGYRLIDDNNIPVWVIDNGVVMDLTHQMALEPTDRLFVSSISKAIQCIIKEQLVVDKELIELKINK